MASLYALNTWNLQFQMMTLSPSSSEGLCIILIAEAPLKLGVCRPQVSGLKGASPGAIRTVPNPRGEAKSSGAAQEKPALLVRMPACWRGYPGGGVTCPAGDGDLALTGLFGGLHNRTIRERQATRHNRNNTILNLQSAAHNNARGGFCSKQLNIEAEFEKRASLLERPLGLRRIGEHN
mmetsp:Transcript_31403/g.50390  ORF Transcript_31403/g.50390 Transcript_31403/m.50390 type:complete len:179 (+) Transcript_31403:69-605(+)